MKIKYISKVGKNNNLALIFSDPKEIDSSIFTEQEWTFVQEQLKDTPNKWISINQYSQHIFLYYDKKQPKGLGLHIEKLRTAGAELNTLTNAIKVKKITINSYTYTPAVTEGFALANYQYLRYLSDKKKKKHAVDTLCVLNSSKKEVDEISNLVEAVSFSRDLVNTPVWDLNATDLAKKATESGKKYGFRTEVFNKKKIESLKMGGLLAVNKGSIDPPTFIIMEHKPKNIKNKKPIVFVGKGVVYDTGGLSLKPTSYMDDMKSDMGGSAAVIGAMQAIASNNLPYHVIGLVPATDNRPGGNAVTPGDVITISNGKTVEVMNTDAEGRLILSDALVYAQKYKPELVIDLATLTGAAANAIGRYGIVAMGEADDIHWEKAKESGNNVHERLVEFPFWDDYDELLESPIADLKNIGGPIGGAITAGKFLANFTDYPYIHLDIAGPAFVDSDKGYIKKGATGVGVRLLYDLVKNF